MRQTLPFLALVALLTSAAVSVLAASPTADSEAASADSRFEELLAMSAKDRRAELKTMAPDERRGLWFELKKAQNAQRNAATADSPSGLSSPAATKRVRTEPPSVNAVGTIQYDDGTGSTIFGEISTPSNILRGNRFDTHGGGNPVTMSGTVQTIVAVVKPGTIATTNSAGFVLYNEQNTVTGGAMAAFSTFTSAGTGMTETVTFAGMSADYLGGSFMVLFGNFEESYIPVFGAGTTAGQGHHAVAGDTGGIGPNITATSPMSGLNARIQATGNVLPVELMTFEVD